MRAVVRTGAGVGSLTEAGAYDGGHGMQPVSGNQPVTGQAVSGADLGTLGYSMEGTVGQTGCMGTDWVSDSLVACLVGAEAGCTLIVVVVGWAH